MENNQNFNERQEETQLGRRMRARLDTLRQTIGDNPVIEIHEGPTQPTVEEHGPDGGWGWVVLIASFICLCVLDGVAYTFGVFLDPLLVEMGGGRGQVSMAGSLLVATYAFTGPLAAMLVKRYGTRLVCVLGALLSAIGLAIAAFTSNIMAFIAAYSILTGFGFGLMYLPSVVAVANHFTKLRSTAIGICLCGAGVGTFLLAPLESYLIENHGRRTAFIVLALIAIFCVLCGITMRPVKYVPVHHTDETTVTTEEIDEPLTCGERVITLLIDRKLYRSPEFRLFLLIALADVLATFALFIPFHYLPPVARAEGITKTQAAFLISSIGMSSTAGRLFAGWLADRPWFHSLTISAVAIVLAFPVIFLLTVVTTYPAYLTLAILFGFFTGSWVACMNPVFVQVLGLHLLTSAFGILTAMRGITSLLGPPIAGQSVEQSGDKRMALYTSGIFMTASALFFTLAAIWNHRRRINRTYIQL